MHPRLATRILASLVLVSFSGCSLLGLDGSNRGQRVGQVPLYEGLGASGRTITTESPKAQQYFNQGLNFLFAFNHDEARRSFRKAAELDPKAAMAWWGIAISYGPHINYPFLPPEPAKEAFDALQQARRLAAGADETEAALIGALAYRYADPTPEDRRPLDAAYSDTMRIVWINHPKDADIGALFAESMMDLRPWNQWTREGEPGPGTLEVLTTLDTVFKLRPDHPLALHLYIHAVEASPEPARAKAAADQLRTLQPGLGHLVHMPSHIDVRTGQWRKAVATNVNAIAADEVYRTTSPDQGFYGLYMAHNHHMLAFAAMMIGRRQQATEAVDTMTAAIPPEWARTYAPIADGFLAMPLEVRVRFGAWDEVLAAPEPEPIFPMARAMRHYARGVAYSAKGDTAAARAEQTAFEAERATLPAETQFGNNKGSDLLAVADSVLEGEILYREGKRDAAFKALQRAVDLENQLNYDEPPSWILPARHSLGTALLDSGRARDAEKVFRTDLEYLPNNGWALFGLEKSLRMQGKNPEAAKVQAAFQKAWAGSDYEITSPCACLAGPVPRKPRPRS